VFLRFNDCEADNCRIAYLPCLFVPDESHEKIILVLKSPLGKALQERIWRMWRSLDNAENLPLFSTTHESGCADFFASAKYSKVSASSLISFNDFQRFS
jgi:hypothetical protein